MGEWFFPSGTVLGTHGAGGDIYRNRTGAESASSTSDATVRLNRRNNAMYPIGLYHCEIPDRNGLTQNLCVGIHADSKFTVNKL